MASRSSETLVSPSSSSGWGAKGSAQASEVPGSIGAGGSAPSRGGLCDSSERQATAARRANIIPAFYFFLSVWLPADREGGEQGGHLGLAARSRPSAAALGALGQHRPGLAGE